jgi:hypothetical protein
MFGEELVRAFGQLKAIFDPGNLMNPGKVVAPDRPAPPGTADYARLAGLGWAGRGRCGSRCGSHCAPDPVA